MNKGSIDVLHQGKTFIERFYEFNSEEALQVFDSIFYEYNTVWLNSYEKAGGPFNNYLVYRFFTYRI